MASQSGALSRGRKDLATDICKNVELPFWVYQLMNSEHGLHPLLVKELFPHPGFNTTGKEILLKVNTYMVSQYPTEIIHQYDITVLRDNVHSAKALERGLIKKVWGTATRKAVLKHMIFDGQKLAWSPIRYKETSVRIDLDKELNREPDPNRQPNIFRVGCRPTKTVNLGLIDQFLKGTLKTTDRDTINSVLEGIAFFDHLIREWPSWTLIPIKKNFYNEKDEPIELSNAVMCFKGIHQAIRLVQPGKMLINIDVANTAFWSRISVPGVARALLDARNNQEVVYLCKPKKNGEPSEHLLRLSHFMAGLTVKPKFEGNRVDRNFRIARLSDETASKKTFNREENGQKIKTTIVDYFRQKYNLRLPHPELPVVELQSKEHPIFYPMDTLIVTGLQRYPHKLDEVQTDKMIKAAAVRPAERLRGIEKNKQQLDHENDPVLGAFGMKVDSPMMKIKGRLLPTPDIQFGNSKHNPGTSGRWDLRGKKFLKGNRTPLKSWGVGYYPGKRNVINRTQVEQFCDTFMKQYSGHGGSIAVRPYIMELKDDIAEALFEMWNLVGKKFDAMPQLMMIVVPNKDPFFYLRVKKSCDCRFGVASQVVQSAHVIKNFPQYSSNVAMKVNAKLGGVTSRVIPRTPDTQLRPGSVIIGADVSHSSPASKQHSMSAMSCSMDSYGSKYMGACQESQFRVEIMSGENINYMLTPMLREWCAVVGNGRAPANLYYFRDGVSTGQQSHVLEEEVQHIRNVLGQIIGSPWTGKICVIIANKRHHYRAFPNPADKNSADKNGNPLPGTLVERDITLVGSWNFLLYSHTALQGTSRPVHYHVIRDEIGHKPQQIQNLIYDHCYQYVRSTTSVSLFPAVYYAHLISNRARHHADVPAKEGMQSGREVNQMKDGRPSGPIEPPKPLMKIKANSNKLALEMWYV